MTTITRQEDDVKSGFQGWVCGKRKANTAPVLAAFAIVAEKKQETLDRGVESSVSC